MILEIALAVAAGSALVGLANAVRNRRARPASSELADAMAAARPARETGLASGDVVAIPGEELLLGGAITLDESGVVLTAFALIGKDRDRWLVQLDRAGNDLALMKETTELAFELPSTLPIGGRTLTLEKRGVAVVSARGEGVPSIDGARAPFVVLSERGGRIAIVIDAPTRIALLGERIDPRVVDRLGGASATR